MFENKFVLLGISTIAAAVPIAVWLYFIFRKSERSKKTLALVFGIGCFTAPALLLMQELWDKFPNFNLAAFIENNISDQNTTFIAMFVLFGALEEIIKFYVVSGIDKKTLLIQKINDSIRYSLAAALGFAFTENIYYLVEFWPSISLGELVGMFVFRSLFTACAHMIFSGIFGYYYGIGKFSFYLKKQEKSIGKRSSLGTKIISKIFRIPMSHAYQQKMVLKGLVISIVLHAGYNYLLQYNAVLPVIAFVICGFGYLVYLLNRKAGHLLLATDVSSKKTSTLAKKDEDVILELLGMWFKDKKYVDVIHICERLLERDPDNTVVKLFKAKALDKMDDKNIYKKILGTVVKTPDGLSEDDHSRLTKYIEEKEKINSANREKNQQTEKPPPQKPPSTPTPQTETTPEKKKDILDRYTEGDSFKLD